MARLVFPRHMAAFTGRVQSVLFLAEKQGFSIQHISLDVGDSPYFVLIGGCSVVIGSDVCSPENASEPLDYYIQYLTGQSVHQANCTVKVGLPDPRDGDFQIDQWLTKANTPQQIYYPFVHTSLNYQHNQHLAWVLALLALDFPLEDTLCVARAAMSQAQYVSRETWPTQWQHFPVVKTASHSAKVVAFPAIEQEKFTLYPVVDDVAWIELLLKLGVTTVQLRIKDPSRQDLEAQISRAVSLGREYDAQVFINDYWQLAIKYHAYGVHLGQEDLTSANLELLSQAGLRLGLSTHGYFELVNAACIQPSYIALGHIFPTATKQMPSKPQGLVRLAAYQTVVNQMPYHGALGIPTVAIGGIELSNIRDVLACGVTSAAVVRAITLAENPAFAVHQLFSAFYECKEKPFLGLKQKIATLTREASDAQ